MKNTLHIFIVALHATFLMACSTGRSVKPELIFKNQPPEQLCHNFEQMKPNQAQEYLNNDIDQFQLNI